MFSYTYSQSLLLYLNLQINCIFLVILSFILLSFFLPHGCSQRHKEMLRKKEQSGHLLTKQADWPTPIRRSHPPESRNNATPGQQYYYNKWLRVDCLLQKNCWTARAASCDELSSPSSRSFRWVCNPRWKRNAWLEHDERKERGIGRASRTDGEAWRRWWDERGGKGEKDKTRGRGRWTGPFLRASYSLDE